MRCARVCRRPDLRQALVENATVVELDGRRYPVRRTPKRGLRQVDFVYDAAQGLRIERS
jgi:hypothetical protein